jgi:hypothetical protein
MAKKKKRKKAAKKGSKKKAMSIKRLYAIRANALFKPRNAQARSIYKEVLDAGSASARKAIINKL